MPRRARVGAERDGEMRDMPYLTYGVDLMPYLTLLTYGFGPYALPCLTYLWIRAEISGIL